MSTILKALRRLEEEKAAAAPRELREEVAATPRAAVPSRSRHWLPLGAVVACLGLAIAWWGWQRDPAVTPAPPAPVVAEVAPPATIRVSLEPTIEARAEAPRVAVSPDPPQVEVPGLPEQAFSSPVKVVPRPTAKPRIPMEEPAAPTMSAPRREIARAETPEADAQPSRPAPARSPQAAALPEPVPAAPAPDPFPQRAVRETRTVSAPSEGVPADRSTSEIAAPSLRVEKTLWHPRPDRREALVAVDGGVAQRIQEGDVVGRSLVSEIQPSAVVFERDGEKIRRAIGEK